MTQKLFDFLPINATSIDLSFIEMRAIDSRYLRKEVVDNLPDADIVNSWDQAEDRAITYDITPYEIFTDRRVEMT